MLRIIGQISQHLQSLEFDPYVPFTASLGPPPATVVYWRVVTGDTNLLEVGLDASSGAISSVTLTMLDAGRLTRGGQSQLPTAVEIGVPVCDLTPWGDSGDFKSRFIDEHCDLRLDIDAQAARLRLGATASVRQIASGKISFGVDVDDTLVEIIIHPLTSTEAQALVEAITG